MADGSSNYDSFNYDILKEVRVEHQKKNFLDKEKWDRKETKQEDLLLDYLQQVK